MTSGTPLIQSHPNGPISPRSFTPAARPAPPSLRVTSGGAAPAPAAIRAAFEERTGVALSEGYGLTEATCASARTFIDVPRPGSVGQRLPYQEFKTIAIGDDGSWQDLPAGQLGN